MKIIYITDQIHLHGGAEKILIQKLNYWVEWYGYDVLLITSEQRGKKPFFHLNEKVQWVDLGINYIEGVSYFNPKNFTKFPKHYSTLKTAIHEFKPDAIFLLSLGLVRFILPLIASRFRIYNEYHTSYYGFHLGYQRLSALHKIKKNITNAAIAFVESFYTKIVFLNDAEFKHYNRKNGVIIPNFFDEIKHPVSGPKKNQAISLGRLSYQKGYDLLIDVWEIVNASVDDWTLEIYGNGENHDALQEQIRNKNLQDTIHLNKATDNVNEKLSESAFYVMSSRFETFPMVLLEAMSNALPVVSFDCPTGPASMLTPNEDSYLVPHNDVSAMAERMIFIMRNEELRNEMGQKALQNVKRFNPQAIMRQWDELIKNNI